MEGIYIKPIDCTTCFNYISSKLDPILCKIALKKKHVK